MKLSQFLNKDLSINIKRVLKSLKSSEYYDYFIEEYNKGFNQPSKIFSEKIGFDIHKEWDLPWNYVDFELLIYATRDSEEILKELYNIVVELNPTLKNINLSSEHSIHELLLGVTSQFNKDDIEEFIGGGAYWKKKQCTDWYNKVNKLESIFGHIQYVPSYKTLNYIFEKLEINI